jgi:hypothetical protein
MKVYLDDERTAPDGWILVKKVEDVIYLYDNITDLSLDHDLGEGNKTGYDFLCWLEEKLFCFPGTISKLPNITIHSQNPVGRQNMQRVLQSIIKFYNKK